MSYYKSVTELIGNTPLLELSALETAHKTYAKILAKVEGMNPAGSIKDRAALSMILDAEKNGILKKGGVLIEPTSGNTGIGLACVAASRGYRLIIVMPDTMSPERQSMIKAYGAEIILTDGALGMNGAIKKAEELAKEIPGSWIPGQFVNPSNPDIHYNTTGPEIWKDTDGCVDFFVAGVGTGGTITGIGRYLKEKNPKIRIVAVEPSDSAVLSGKAPGPHKLQGIGAGFIPEILEKELIDEIIPVTSKDAFDTGREIARTEGLLTGISAGAAVYAALVLAKNPENSGKTIVVILPDNGDRYLSTSMFQDD